MISESLQSIYQQYKDDTEIVASWLATIATTFGYSDPVGVGESSTAKTPVKPSGKLKGKERKKVKAAQASGEKLPEQLPEPPKPSYMLAIKDFVPLAKHILDSSDAAKIEIPRPFSVALLWKE